MHATDFFEVFIFEKGNGRIELNGYSLDVADKTVFFISPYQKKSCYIDPATVRGFHLVFQNDFLADFFEDKFFSYRMHYFFNAQHPQFLALAEGDFSFLSSVLRETIAEIKDFQNDSYHIIRSLLYFSLAKLNRFYALHYGLSSAAANDSIIYGLKESVEENIRKYHRVDAYCSLLGVQRNKLNTIVKAHFGIPVKEFIHFRLLQEIKVDLMYTDKTISEIANDLNFSEANNLSRFFQRLEGESPTGFRATYQNDRTLA